MIRRDGTVFGGAGPVVVGHRGGRGEGWSAENTQAAFARAADEGARAIELDVRTCASGEVVVFHDETLTRMTAGADTRRVADVRWFDLARVVLAGGARVLLLSEVLASSRDRGVAVNVELKHDVPSRIALARAVASTIAAASDTEVLASSFDPRILALFAAFAPRVRRALITSPAQREASLLHAIAPRAALFAIHAERRQTSPELVARWKRRGLRVGVWTVNDPREARDLVRLGVDFVITDHPGEILAGL